MKRADSLLAPLIKNLGIENEVKLGRIRQEWAAIFEKPVSLHMSPASLKEGEVLINVDSPMWLQQLSFYKKTIAEKLSAFGVKTVRLRLGRVLPEKSRDSLIPKVQVLTAHDRTYIETVVSSISDAELKERIKKAIEKSIALKQQPL